VVIAIVTLTLVVTAIATAIHRDNPLSRSPGYQAYMQGVYFQGNRWMAGGCRNAEGYLLDSIARDHDFAPAYAALAWCYAYPDRADRPIEEISHKAKEWASRALVLDNRLALAHAVSGTIKWRVEYDPLGAEPAFKTALALDPHSGLVRLPYAELLLWHRHQRNAGLDLLRPVIDLDPFSPDRHVQVGFILMSVGVYDEAIARFRKALELDPEYGVATLWLAETYAYKNERDLAIREYLRWIDVSLRRDRSVSTHAELERTFSSAGWDAFWREELSMVLEEKAHRGSLWAPTYVRYTGSYYMARRFARLGDWERALDALEAAYHERHHLMAMVPVDPLFVPLQGSSRFRALLRRMGAPL
jgi:tetratricopeptide (TPR) repeat protein